MSTQEAGVTQAAGTDGRVAWPGDPEAVTAADIDFEALAHVLANTCRFGARTREYHSLAAHALIASEEIEALDGLDAEERRRLALYALIADAPSAWLRGEPAGSQRAAERTARLSARIERAVREAVGLEAAPGESEAELLRFVARMTAAAEARDLADADAGAGAAFPPLKRRIRTVGPGRAAHAWLARLRALIQPPREGGAGAAGGGSGDGSNANAGEEGDGAGRPAAGKKTRDTGQQACVFRSKPITHSSANRSLIPFQADHPFQSKPITDSSSMPITFGVGTGTVRGV